MKLGRMMAVAAVALAIAGTPAEGRPRVIAHRG